MTGTVDNYIIELDCLYEKGLIVGGIGSDVFFEKTISLDEKDIVYNPNKYKKTYATIVAIPQSTSERCKKEGGATIFNVGDTVHFYWSALNDSRFIEKKKYVNENGDIKYSFLYILPVWRAICVTHNGTIVINKNFVLLSPIVQSEDEIKTSSGLFVQSEVKKYNNCGRIEYINENERLVEYEDVYFLPNSNSEVTIEGVVYYAMQESDIFAIKRKDLFFPIKDYVLITPYLEEVKTKGGVLLPESHRKFMPKGYVSKVGGDVAEISENDFVHFDELLGVFESPIGDFIIVKESGIVYKEIK